MWENMILQLQQLSRVVKNLVMVREGTVLNSKKLPKGWEEIEE